MRCFHYPMLFRISLSQPDPPTLAAETEVKRRLTELEGEIELRG